MAQIRFNNSGAIRIITRSAREGIGEIMEDVLKQAKADTPVKTERLRNSGHINHNQKSISIMFETPYAAIQHENLAYNHPNGGKAKFLEDAFNSIVPGAIRGRLTEKIKNDLGNAP